MEEREKKAYDFAGDVTKQLITLSIGILTLCIAFTDKIFSSEVAHANSCLIFIALALFTISVICGIMTLMKLTGTIAKNPNNRNDYIYDCWTRRFSGIQMISFLVAVIFCMLFVGCSLGKKQEMKKQKIESFSCIDSICIKVKYVCPNAPNKSIKKRSDSFFYKYIKVNTCFDTIVLKQK